MAESNPNSKSRSSSSSDSTSSGSETESPPATPLALPNLPCGGGSVEVANMTVNEGMGVFNGNLMNFTLNQFIGVTSGKRINSAAVKDLVSDAVKINSETKKQFFLEGTSQTKACSHGVHMPGTREELGQAQETCNCWVMTTVLIGLIPLMSTTLFSTLVSPAHPTHPQDDTAHTHSGGRGGDTNQPCKRQIKHYTSEDIINMKDGPRIFPRMFWCARPSTDPLDNLRLPVKRVVVCHTITEGCDTTPDCIKGVRYIQIYHIDCRGWLDIGYNFLIGGDGNVYEGRGWDKVGQHTKGQNMDSLGIAFLGTYNKKMPKPEMILAFHKLLAVVVAAGKIAEDYSLVAQCQLTVTSSPGLPLAQAMASWAHFDHTLPIRCPAVGDIDV